MIKSLIFMFIVFNAYAVEDLQQRWLTVFKISEIHPEYNLRDEIKHPEGTWQLMAKVHSLEAFGKTNRADCLFVKVPQSGDGEIKVIAINENQSCAEARENDSLYRWKKLKKIAIQIQEDSTTFTLTDDAGRVVRENFKFLNTPKKSRFEIHSQPESKDVIYFQPNSLKQNNSVVKLIGELKDQYPANPCNFDSSSCQDCRFGVYRINTGEYFCGIDQCGEKNNPACLRGTKWQHSREDYSCRGVNSHIFCKPGLKVECEGERAICR